MTSDGGAALKSHVIVRNRESGHEIPALSNVIIEASSDSLGWTGLRLEVGRNYGCNMDDVMIDGHHLIFNLGPSTLNFEMRVNSGWIPGSQRANAFWIMPEGRAFSIRHKEHNHWASVVIDGAYLDSVLGHHHELNPATDASDAVLAHMLRALIARLHDHQGSFNELDRELMRAFVFTLAKRHGTRAAELQLKGGIAPHQLRLLMNWLPNHLEDPLTIESMASIVGLSTAHFSREFKRSTGMTPWGYVVQMRLERAHALLRQGEPISSTAKACGFSDHSHLSRLFKQKFGISPITLVRGLPAAIPVLRSV